jgi:iron complex transport system ATP-binding protein
MRLHAAGVRVRYPGASLAALDGVSARVEPGRLLAVVGPNGSGKSTLFRALLGLVDLEAGEVRLDGTPVPALPRARVAQTVAAVPQHEEPMPMLRVTDAVLMGRYARLGPLTPVSAADREAIRRALERCDAWPLRDRVVDTLSGGEWQRVRLARALAQEPALLLLDEPTAALDIRHEMELLELTRHLVAAGLGALVITHHLNLAARYADEVLLLARGRTVAAGPPSEVFRGALLQEVFDWPLAVTTWCDGAPQVTPLRPGEPGFPPVAAEASSPPRS